MQNTGPGVLLNFFTGTRKEARTGWTTTRASYTCAGGAVK